MRRALDFVIGAYPDISAADGGLSVIECEYAAHEGRPCDAALIARRADDRTEAIYRRAPEEWPGSGEDILGCGLAAGLATALFPHIWIGEEPLSAEQSAVISAVTACVVQGLGRAGLMELGGYVDAAHVVLIVAAEPGTLQRVREAMGGAASILARPADLDPDTARRVLAARLPTQLRE